tara:strand:- start:1735 stop:2436 length:702 start_codon:yes stop_codon:yes gene_type:complete
LTILISASPGSASNTLRVNLEKILNTKSKFLNIGTGIGHLFIKIPFKEKILKKFKLNNTKLIYGHIFPTKHNLNLLEKYYDIKEIIFTYRNIHDQLNYLYKWKKYKLRCPLSFPDEVGYAKNFTPNQNNFDIDLNLLLILNFYKLWFNLIEKNYFKNLTLISFKEIVSFNTTYQNKIRSIIKHTSHEWKNVSNYQIKENVFDKEEFKPLPRHKNMIDEFILINKDIDFSLILK